MTTYKESGVDLEQGAKFVKRISGIAALTLSPNVIAQVGGFAGCYELPTGYDKPVMVTSTDGVGTKLLLALNNQQHLLTIGNDVVAMVVNDIVCCGAEPLVFLDYFAASTLDLEQGEAVIAGIADACIECNVSLVGGETAELPGMYKPGEFDIAGFGVGIVEKDCILDGRKNVVAGDVLIGIESSGPHSNGYSLIRRIITNGPGWLSDPIVNQLMAPTTLYPPVVKQILQTIDVHGIAHITGGGFFENIPRIVDDWYTCVIDTASWERSTVFDWLQETGPVGITEMYNVFNMGIGMVIIVPPELQDRTISTIETSGLRAWKIGHVEKKEDGSRPSVELR